MLPSKTLQTKTDSRCSRNQGLSTSIALLLYFGLSVQIASPARQSALSRQLSFTLGGFTHKHPRWNHQKFGITQAEGKLSAPPSVIEFGVATGKHIKRPSDLRRL
ncbi:hypothetical protein L596_014592 [Steinernema carpocapsae]|uniref:Uncharacterized protein n=1 Tax=Steinernema carpocapsae TaxID=34508 RepID=A0A4U5ND59_STECR|nr:hypothetical protein L596_014592 [Steinernema carpocapsae]